MKLHSVVVHEIRKQEGIVGSKFRASQKLLDIDDEQSMALVKELNNRYKYRTENYGIFDDKKKAIFHKHFKKYLVDINNDSFLEFTIKSAKDLSNKMDSNAPTKGGYLVFARYEEYRHYLSIFLIRDTNGVLFRRNQVNKSFDLKKSPHIDFEKMAMACRINLDAYNDKEGRYLSFIDKKRESVSDFFMNWISSKDNETNRADTRHLFDILNNLEVPKDENGNVQEKDSFLNKVYNHITGAVNRTVNIRLLSKLFYHDADYLSNHIEEQAIPISHEFKADRDVLKKFVTIKVKSGKFEISFPRSEYKKTVRFNQNNANQLIIESETLSNSIRKAIEENDN